MDVMICRWSYANNYPDVVAWVSTDSLGDRPHHVLSDYITEGTTMEILETLTLPDPRQPGFIADRCQYWRKTLGAWDGGQY